MPKKGLVTPTEIQQKTIPALLGERSIVGVAETGSGKTLAYALPIMHILKTLENERHSITVDGMPRACVVADARAM